MGAGLAMVLWAAMGREPGIVPVIILAVLGAVGALAVQRHVIIVATALAGAQTAVVGAAELIGGKGFDARRMFHVYPLDPVPDTRWDLVAFFVLGALGLVLQLRMKATKKR
jgi:hypothetical protein